MGTESQLESAHPWRELHGLRRLGGESRKSRGKLGRRNILSRAILNYLAINGVTSSERLVFNNRALAG